MRNQKAKGKRQKLKGEEPYAAKRRFHFCLLLFAFCLLPFRSSVLADFELKRWAKWREVIIADKAAPADYQLVELDGKVFDHAREDLSDLRMVDGSGTEVPSRVTVERDESREEERRATMLNQAQVPGERSSFTLDLGADPPRHNRLRLDTASRNFSRRVTIEASHDQRQWAMLRGDGYIFDFSRDAATRFLTVSYPLSTHRYLRITIWNKNEEPLAITGAAALLATEQSAQLHRLPAALISQEQDAKLRASMLLVDLGHHLPSSRLEFQPEASNFHRRVELEGSNEQKSWAYLGGTEIFDIEVDRLRPQHLRLDYHEAQFRYLRIKVFNYDDQPIKFSEVRVYGYPYYLLFRREPGKSCRLFYGNPSAAAPRYDLEHLAPYLKIEQLPVASLADERDNQEFARRARESWLERQPIWLWATLVVAALVLGTLIYRLAKLSAGR